MSTPTIYPTGTTIYAPDKCWSGYTVFIARETGIALVNMKCRALEMKIQAKLIHSGILTTGVKIEVNEPHKARVHGAISDKVERQKIIEVLDTIPELKEVEVNIALVALDG